MHINKLAWLTDTHLNFLDTSQRVEFYQAINNTESDAILITGDIAEARDVCELLNEFSMHTNKPIYFVLGNHDYYFGSVSLVRDKIGKLCAQNSQLIWLGKPAIITLNACTTLVGQDGWADARYGDFDHSSINLNDSRLISELYQAVLLNKQELKRQMQKLADADAEVLEETLLDAINPSLKKVIIATHVPPFPECSWHIDKPNDKNWLPYFSSKATGDVISKFAKLNPHIDFLVLCGHTHTRKSVKFFENLEIKTGNAEYYYPELQEIIKLNGH